LPAECDLQLHAEVRDARIIRRRSAEGRAIVQSREGQPPDAPRREGVEPMSNVEKLKCVAIMRAGQVIERGFKDHYSLRASIGDEKPSEKQAGDVDGFITTTGRFVTRLEARDIGAAARQCQPAKRPLLSSDVDSWAT
jgi:hypothetical protein